MSMFTWPKHYTLMTLWCIARSSLMMGGDLLTSSEKSLSFFKNPEVLAVNQESEKNHQVYNRNQKICWFADVQGTRDKYLALFNLADEKQKVTFEFEWEYLRDSYMVRDLWAREDLGIFQKEFGMELEPHGAGLYKLTREYDQTN